MYENTPESMKGKYSPAECIGSRKQRMTGKLEMKHVSTSYSKRSNPTMRMHNRRFTRFTNAFSKKFKSHVRMVAIWTAWYNRVPIHKILRTTPAIAADMTSTLWTQEMTVAKMDEVALKPGRPRTYRKRGEEISK
jgi:hypothetical protein